MESEQEVTAPSRIVVDYISIGIPARRYGIKATIGFDTRVPLLQEFALRLLRTLENVNGDLMRGYFGLTSREWDILLSELSQSGLVSCRGDYVALSGKGKALFRDRDDEEPRIAIVETFEQNVVFESATLSPLQRVSYDDKLPRSLLRLGSVVPELAANASTNIRESFKKHFTEIAQTYLPKKVTHERAYVYSVDEVVPKRSITYEVELPIELEVAKPMRVRIGYSTIERGRYGSRDKLLQMISAFLNPRINVVNLNNEASARFLGTFDEGLLSNETWSTNFSAIEPMRDFDTGRTQSGDVVKSTFRFLGSLLCDDNRDWFLDRTDPSRFKPELEGSIFWLRPGVPFWGRSSRFESFFQELKRRNELTKNCFLIAPRNDQLGTERDLRSWFSNSPTDNSGFDCGFGIPDNIFPSGIELIFRPGMWMVAIAQIYDVDSEASLPIGIFSEAPIVVSSCVSEFAKGFMISAVSTLWHQPDTSAERALESAIAFLSPPGQLEENEC